MIGPALAGLLIAALGSGVPATGAVIILNGLSYGAVDPVRCSGCATAMLNRAEPVAAAQGA